MMTYDEFKNSVERDIKKYLPESEKDSVVNMSSVVKNNGVKLDSISIKGEMEQVSPVVYLEQYYDRYTEGDYYEKILQEIADTIVEAKKPTKNFDISKLYDYANIKDSLILSVCNYKTNKEMLENLPHEIRGDFAVTVKSNLEEVGGTMQINNALLNTYGIEKEQLFADAYENAPQNAPVDFRSMREILMEMMPGFEPEEEIPDVAMYVLSNEQKKYGASAIFYPGVLEEISYKLQSDLYIIPSSVHEVIIITGKDVEAEQLRCMIEEVNATQVDPVEVLGNQPYTYDAIMKEIVPMCNYEKNIDAIKGDLIKSGFRPTEKLINGMRRIEKFTGQRQGLKDMYSLAKSITKDSEPGLKEAINDVAKECKVQEMMRPGMEPS